MIRALEKRGGIKGDQLIPPGRKKWIPPRRAGTFSFSGRKLASA